DHDAGAVGAGIAGDARGVGDDVALARAGPADQVVLGGDAGQVDRVHGVAGRRVPVRQDADQVALNPVARGLDGHAAAVGGDDVALADVAPVGRARGVGAGPVAVAGAAGAGDVGPALAAGDDVALARAGAADQVARRRVLEEDARPPGDAGGPGAGRVGADV